MSENDYELDESQVFDLVLTEFQLNARYLRHVEELRVSLIRIYLLVFGAVLAITSFLAKGQAIEETVTRYRELLATLFLGLFLFGGAVIMFVARQKAGYEHYRDVNANIRALIPEKIGRRVGYEVPADRSSRGGSLKKSPFFWLLVALCVVNSAALFLFLWVVALERQYSLTALVAVSVVSVVLQVCVFRWLEAHPTFSRSDRIGSRSSRKGGAAE